MKNRLLFTFLFFIITITSAYSNSYDIPMNLSARANGMGGAGMASCDGGVSLVINPAGIANTKKFQFEGTYTNMYIYLQAPANGPGTKSTTNEYSAMGHFGAAYRINDILTAGLVLYSPSAGGMKFKRVNFGDFTVPRNDFTGRLVFIEFGPGFALNLPYGIKIGAVYRMHYVEQWSNVYDLNVPVVNNTYNNVHLSGLGFTGFKVGIQYNPIKPLHIGLMYRNRVKINTKGVIKINPVGSPVRLGIAAKSAGRYNDKISAGITYEIINSKLFLSFDYGLDFYSNYLTTTVRTIFSKNVVPVKTKDVHSFRLGIEIFATEKLPIRFGAIYSTPHGNETYHNVLSSGAPGANYTGSFGTGYKITENMEINFSYSYMINKGSVGVENIVPTLVSTGEYRVVKEFSTPGNYQASGSFISIELRYSI